MARRVVPRLGPSGAGRAATGTQLFPARIARRCHSSFWVHSLTKCPLWEDSWKFCVTETRNFTDPGSGFTQSRSWPTAVRSERMRFALCRFSALRVPRENQAQVNFPTCQSFRRYEDDAWRRQWLVSAIEKSLLPRRRRGQRQTGKAPGKVLAHVAARDKFTD